MCGIIGFIGNSTNPEATFDLTNQLMIKTEPRGLDATGFWATTSGEDNRIIYHKEPVKSSIFVTHDLWRGLQEHNTDLFIGHCRWTSTGGGSEKVNKNNHPHVSKDFRLSLVHNGKIPEYNFLKKKYDTKTDCDSEILLRILESGEDYHDKVDFLRKELPKIWEDTPNWLLYRIYGLKKLFSEVTYGAFAVAIGERLDDQRSLFLFRNEARPICLIDLRESLGQIFFCSTPEIFRQAVEEAKIAKTVIPDNQPVYPELPSYWIYSFVLNKDNKIDIRRLKVNKVRKYGQWRTETEEVSPKSESKLVRTTLDVVTQLNNHEEPVKPEKIVGQYTTPTATTLTKFLGDEKKNSLTGIIPARGENDCSHFTCYGDDDDPDPEEVGGGSSHLRRENSVSKTILNQGFQEIRTNRHEDEEDDAANDFLEINEMVDGATSLCTKIEKLSNDISTKIYNKHQESSLTKGVIEQVVEGLTEILGDLESLEDLAK